MKANIGGWDRVLRFVVGLALLALAATGVVGLAGRCAAADRTGALLPAVPVAGLEYMPRAA